MTDFERDTCLSETIITAHKAKAIADAFAREYIDSSDYHLTALLIEDDPDNFVYLFTAIHDTLCELCSWLEKLEESK